MRFEFLAGLWAVLGLASLPLARADATLNAWNQLMIDQLRAGFSPFVSYIIGSGCGGRAK